MELAISLPILTLMLVGAIDFGRVFRTTMIVQNAARAGALYGSQNLAKSTDNVNMIATAKNVLTANGLTTGPDPLPSRLCQCASDLGVFTATVPANTCTYTCPSGGHMVYSVTVSAQRTFSMTAAFPGLPTSITITRAATMRAMP